MPEPGAVLDHVKLDVLHSSSQIPELFEWLSRRREVLGIDTETGGFDHIRDPLRMVQLGDLHQGWAIPWERWSGVAVEILRRYQGPLVLHNSPFDIKFLQRNAPEIDRWPWDRTNDTLTIAHLINPLRSKNLKAFAAVHVDPSAASAARSLEDAKAANKWTWATVPWNLREYWGYAAMDPVLTCHIFDRFKAQTINGGSREAYGIEMGTLRVVTNMMRKGALVDLQYCQEQVNTLGDYAAEIRGYLAQTYKINSVWSSDRFEGAFDAAGADVPLKLTAGGKQSWDKEVLESINHDLARYILGVRKIEKQLGPYFSNFQRMADSGDRVHPTIWSMGTRTGRQTVTDPALQTLPKKDPTIRGAFIPAPGYVLITIDADQIEARLAAHFSGDRGMIEAFSGEDDFFVAMAKQIFQDQLLQKVDPRRQLTKNTIYGGIYGAGPAKMAATSRVSLDQMQTFVAGSQRDVPWNQAAARLNQPYRYGTDERRGPGVRDHSDGASVDLRRGQGIRAAELPNPRPRLRDLEALPGDARCCWVRGLHDLAGARRDRDGGPRGAGRRSVAEGGRDHERLHQLCGADHVVRRDLEEELG